MFNLLVLHSLYVNGLHVLLFEPILWTLKGFSICKNHVSVWYANNKQYINYVKEDSVVRSFIEKTLSDTCISYIEISRKLDSLSVNLFVAKPSIVMGVNSSRLYDLRNKLSSLLVKEFSSREITINVFEVLNPDSNSKLLADFVRQQLEKRVPFRRAIKSAVSKAQKSGIKGIKVQVSGRLNGAEIARTEWIREGQVPLHTLQAKIDYCNYKARVYFCSLEFYIILDLYNFSV